MGDPSRGALRLVSAIVELCEPIPQGPLDEHLALSQKCANKPVPKLLRDLKQRGSPPFHPVGRFVSIGVPGKDDQLRIGKASTYLNGELYRRKLRLVNTDNEKTVTVLSLPKLFGRAEKPFTAYSRGILGSRFFFEASTSSRRVCNVEIEVCIFVTDTLLNRRAIPKSYL